MAAYMISYAYTYNYVYVCEVCFLAKEIFVF